MEIISRNERSTDGAKEVLNGNLTAPPRRIVLQERNFGKGAALHAGFHNVTGDLVILRDADLERCYPRECPLLSPILEHRGRRCTWLALLSS